jgi:hypothetical protein
MPSASPNDLQTFVSRVQLVGRATGRVKSLPGFDKSRHTVPDAVNPATSGFLARLCAPELADEAERVFQRARAALGYKRKDLALDVTSPAAVLTAKDFAFEIGYELNGRAPDEFVVTRTLHQLSNAQLALRPEFDELFAGQFGEVGFLLKKGVRVEAVIDAVEALDDEGGLTVDYPSDCRTCTLNVEGVDAAVVCDGASLAMTFPRQGSPRELLEAFAAVREAFALSKQRALAGLLG